MCHAYASPIVLSIKTDAGCDMTSAYESEITRYCCWG